MNPIRARILYSLISILVAWCMAWTAGGTFSVGAGGGGGTTYETPAYVQSVSVYTGTYENNATLSGVASGNVLIMFISGTTSNTVTGVSTSSGSTSAWSSLGTAEGESAYIWVYWCYATGTGNVSAKPTGSASDAGYSMHEYSGVEISSPQIGSMVSAYAESASFSTSNITTTTDKSLLIGMWASEINNATITYGDGWTQRTDEPTHYHKTTDKIVETTGDYNFSGSWTVDVVYVVGYCALKGKKQ